jgi:hypothetical protein
MPDKIKLQTLLLPAIIPTGGNSLQVERIL